MIPILSVQNAKGGETSLINNFEKKERRGPGWGGGGGGRGDVRNPILNIYRTTEHLVFLCF